MRRESLLKNLYTQLRAQAEHAMQHERLNHTLTATALVHEAYLRLGNSFENDAHFYAAAAQAMRRVLIDAARARQRLKRGNNPLRVELSDIPAPLSDDRLLALDAALSSLAEKDPLAANVVELHHFAGLSHDRVAEVLSTTVYEARRLWTFARAWLKNEISDFSSTAGDSHDA